MADREWTTPALTLLDVLWGVDTHMAVMRKKLEPLLGFYPTAAEVRTQAARHQEKPAKFNPVNNAGPPVIVAVDHSDWSSVPKFVTMAPPPKPDNAVRLVKKGTFPADRFSMLGGRSR